MITTLLKLDKKFYLYITLHYIYSIFDSRQGCAKTPTNNFLFVYFTSHSLSDIVFRSIIGSEEYSSARPH